MSNDPNAPRMLRLTITDEGESWLITVDRNRVEITDADVCEILGMGNKALDDLHNDVHRAEFVAAELEAGRN